MPRVFLNNQERARHRLATWIQGEKKAQKVNDTELAEDYGVSQPAMSRKIRLERFEFDDFVYFAHRFGLDVETLRYIIGI